MDRIYGEGFSEMERWKSFNYHYTKEDGLPSNFVNALDEDDERKYIIGTSHGLSIFNGERV